MHARNPRRRVATALVAGTLLAGSATWALAANPAPDTYAFVARGDNPVDALAAAPLAGRLNAPVVLTESTVLTGAAADALKQADPDHVIIAGGEVAISNGVRDAIVDLLPGATVRRASGETRYDTSQAIAALFDDIDPSFLAVDGKANAAEKADLATKAQDADHFGGLAPEEYQFSIVRRVADPAEVTAPNVPDGHVALVDIMPPVSFDMAADGLVRAEMLVGITGSVSGGNLPVYVLIDSDDTVYDQSDNEQTADLLNRIVFAQLESDAIPVPLRVDAGRHTLRVVVFADNEDVTAEYRSLAAHMTTGVSGTWQPFEPAPPAPATARTGEDSGGSEIPWILRRR